MIIALTVLMAAVAFFLVALPVLRRGASQVDLGVETGSLSELLNHRDSVFVALRDLNFDHQVGKVSDEDHAVFEASLKEAAAESLRAIDKWEAAADRLLAQEIVSMQGANAAVGVSKDGTAFRTCRNCARPSAAEDQFCAHCGSRLQAPAPAASDRCPKCGLACAPDDQFCAGCGSRIDRS